MYFKCKRIGYITRNSDKEKKEDGSPLNTKDEQQVHWETFKMNKEAGEPHVIDSKVIDSEPANADEFDFEDILNDDDCEQDFQFYIVGSNSSKLLKVVEDLRGMENHAFNQKGKGN